MICPHCKAEVDASYRFCPECGKDLGEVIQTRKTMRTASGAAFAIGKAARQARLEAIYTPDEIIPTRLYNVIMLGVLLWGLLVNVLLCVFARDLALRMNPIVLAIAYVVCAFAGIMIAGRSHNALISFLGYNLVVIPFGLVLSIMVEEYGGINSSIVTEAFFYTLLITVGMGAVTVIAPSFFEKLGGALFGCLVGMVLCEIVLLFLGANQTITDWIAAGIFSLYIGYDIHRSQQFAKTVDNAVDCALDIYLDVANLFIRLLEILGKKKDS